MTVLHSSFTLEREYPREPARVFAAWADPATKARWFTEGRHALDFRVGGVETVHAGELALESRYHDIVPDERIVYASTLRVADALATVSLTTVQFRPGPAGTTLLLTEQAAHLDGHEAPEWRERGTNAWLDALGRHLEEDRQWRSS